uniref:General negative regulator of transcription subunit n=1 Tax=Candidozyma auris TaxID=498019 RepID=A0A0L0NW92_CANAR
MSTRKLQQECDKLQKKITEGLLVFDDIHEKIGQTDNASQKERLEGDLRKEIKKLQRCRDQVKQWLGDSSVKLDKNLLQDNRSKIENAMERFKEVERVSKMKQFSNEGLEMQTKLGATDEDEAKKNEACRYITDILEELGRQNELLSGELSGYSGKKKLGNAQVAIDELNQKIDRNNLHIGKLEQILHNLTNEQLKPERIDEIKDDLDYYVENNQAADFIEYNDFYDQLELDEAPESFPAATMPGALHDDTKSSKEDSNPRSPAKKDTPTSNGTPSTSSATTAATTITNQSSHPTRPPASAPTTSSASASLSNSGSTTQPHTIHSSQGSLASKPPMGTGPSAAGLAQVRAPPPGLGSSSKSGSPVPLAATPKSSAAELKKKVASSQAGSSLGITPGISVAAALSNSINNNSNTKNASPALSHASTATTVGSSNKAASEAQSAAANPLTQETKYLSEAAVRVHAISQNRLANPLPFLAISQLLETSLLNCPDSSDAERPRQYNPRNVHPLSVDYPQEPMFELNSARIMSKFDNDTLFFCFYYSEEQDNIARYNAARELSKRGWIFNSKTKQWFSKDDRAKSRLASVAQGVEEKLQGESYKYFDYQSSWLIRRKDHYKLQPEVQETF